jgi:uncharacterized protein YbjT (DUF2867 family)
MAPPILVTGGTGTLGRHVVPLLRASGRPVRVLSRRSHEPRDGVTYVTGDLLTGEGVDRAVEGVATVLHLAGGPKGDDEATRRLVEAASRADVQHLVYVSVVGADTVPVGWLRSKHAAEEAVAGSGVPWTTLRAAQFHDLVLTVLQKMARLPVVPVPGGLRFEPVDSREVAERLVTLTLGPPAGRVPDLVGPQVYGMKELVRSYLDATGRHRLTVPVRMPGKAGRAYRAGDNLAARSGASVGSGSWEDFLAGAVTVTGRVPQPSV